MTELRANWKLPRVDRLAPDDPRFVAAMAAHDAACDRDQQGYIDPTTGLFVMTATYLAGRPCCDSNCRHCPWTKDGV